jgi:hypothetical protein
MGNRLPAMAVMLTLIASAGAAQTRKPAARNTMAHEITITAESIYTGTMDLTIAGGVVTGNMLLKTPTEITGKVAGTAKAGVLALEFPYQMTERKCEGTVKMNITLPPKPGSATGTMEAVGCGRDETRKLTGKVELKPIPPAKPK